MTYHVLLVFVVQQNDCYTYIFFSIISYYKLLNIVPCHPLFLNSNKMPREENRNLREVKSLAKDPMPDVREMEELGGGKRGTTKI